MLRLRLDRLRPTPKPSQSYDEAVERVEILRQRASAHLLNSASETILLTHGQPTEQAILLLHGYTSSPQQFRQLGELFHAQGFNVLIPRMPLHGMRERIKTKLGKLSAEMLAPYAQEALDITVGLGKQVTVMGLSAGGVLTAYLATTRSDFDHAIMIAPVFGIGPVQPRFTRMLIRAMLFAPNRTVAWDASADPNVGPDHAYPQWATRGLGHIMRLGLIPQTTLPLVKRATFVTNDNDFGVNNALTDQVQAFWEQGGSVVRGVCFSAEEQLDHDLIDPAHPNQNVEYVYPVLLGLANPI